MASKNEPRARPIKPAFMSPCNGCGLCCLRQRCTLSLEYLESRNGVCAALEISERGFTCGLVTNPSKYLGIKFDGNAILTPLYSEALGIGKGCDAETEEDGVYD